LIRYLDTSILVAALTIEAKTAEVQLWLSRQPVDDLAISEWVTAEFSAALSIKLRNRQIDPKHRAEALTSFARMSSDNFEILPVLSSHFRTAARSAENYELGLRAADALHMAIAVDYGATLCTLDKRLAKAASALGCAVELL
jgi:uncharacterized protein